MKVHPIVRVALSVLSLLLLVAAFWILKPAYIERGYTVAFVGMFLGAWSFNCMETAIFGKRGGH
jgi:dipeptide/tripeptide permease